MEIKIGKVSGTTKCAYKVYFLETPVQDSKDDVYITVSTHSLLDMLENIHSPNYMFSLLHSVEGFFESLNVCMKGRKLWSYEDVKKVFDVNGTKEVILRLRRKDKTATYINTSGKAGIITVLCNNHLKGLHIESEVVH